MSKQPLNVERIFYLNMIEVLLLILVTICLFYLLRYIDNEKWAERIGIGLFSGITLIIIIITLPIFLISLDIIFSQSVLRYTIEAILSISLIFALWFISGVFYYFTISSFGKVD